MWSLDPRVTFLNHGSFGACPLPVQRAQQRVRDRLESEPVRFFLREHEPLLDEARSALASLLAADAGDLAFVPNATAGVNTVLAAYPLAPGDELLVTDHEYNACRNALDAVAARSGTRVVVARIPFPLASPDEVVDVLCAAVTPRTRLALVDHVTSPTALVLPIERVVSELSARAVDVLVDGAHAPAMVPLALDALGAPFYTGNCHKWLCAPKGAAFLHVRRDRQDGIRPLAISHGANSPRTDRSRFRLEHDWTGTHDPSAYLAVPEAIRVLGSALPGGLPALMARNRALALEARDILCDALGVSPPCPDTMIGSMASVPLPPLRTNEARPAAPMFVDPIQEELFVRDAIEVPVIPWPPPDGRLLRVSAQLYNERAQYERLAAALQRILR